MMTWKIIHEATYELDGYLTEIDTGLSIPIT